MGRIGYTILVLFSLWSMGVSSQSKQEEYSRSGMEKRELDRDEWKNLRENIKYKKAKLDIEDWEGEAGDGESTGKGSGSGGSGSGGSGTQRPDRSAPKDRSSGSTSIGSGGLFIAILLFVLILGFLIYKYLSNPNRVVSNTNVEPEPEEDNRSPQDIPKTELELRLEKALTENDFREAVRVYFIFIIKGLSEKDWIRWEKEKTNMSYLVEMSSRPEYALFASVTRVFEYVWYGKRQIDETQFREVEPNFKKLLQSIKD